MRIIFAHDHYFVRNGKYYYSSSGSFPSSVLKRYSKVFDEVIMLTRQKDLINTSERKNLSLANTENVDFIKVPDFKSLTSYYKKKEAQNIIKEHIRASDGLIARLPSSIGAVAISIAKKYKKPYLVELVGCPLGSLWNYGSLMAKMLAPFAYLRTKRLVNNARFVIYVSNEFLQRRYPTRGKSIACSNVNIPEQSEKVLEYRLEKIHLRKKNKPLILGTAAAVHVKNKGHKYVIKALSKLVKCGYNFEYHLAGGGSRTFLTFVAEKYGVVDRVEFLGPVQHEKIFSYFDSIDIYIQPSKQEGLPRALIEAMSRGCPALGSSAGGIPELLDPQFVFRKGSTKDIKKILKEYDKKTMKNQAIINFEKAKEYNKKILEKRRSDFLLKFKKSILLDNNGKNNVVY